MTSFACRRAPYAPDQEALGGGGGGGMRGVMKPDVVFFGDIVRADVREAAERAVELCSGETLNPKP
jgi:NAD-dependent SIR2 family protein deacetylase